LMGDALRMPFRGTGPRQTRFAGGFAALEIGGIGPIRK